MSINSQKDNDLKYPLISVIIPTYNSEKFLRETIESVLSQTYPNIEIIIIDDGSTDSSDIILGPYLKKIQYHLITHSGLPAVARNQGILYSKGEFIAFLDSDDIWLPGKLLEQYNIFLKFKNIGLVSTNAIRFVDKKDNKIVNEPKEKLFHRYTYSTGVYHFNDLLSNNFIVTSSVVVSKNCLVRSGFFPEDKKFRAIEDYHLWLRIALLDNIYYIDEPLLKYRDRIDSIRSEQSIITSYERMIEVYSNLLYYVKLNYPLMNEATKRIKFQIAFIFGEFGKYCLKKNKILSFGKGLMKFFITNIKNIAHNQEESMYR